MVGTDTAIQLRYLRLRGVRCAPLSYVNFHLESSELPGVTVVTVTGELDIASAPQLESALSVLTGRPLVVVDLSTLEFVDSTGLSVLVRAHQRATEQGHRFGLVRGPGQVQKLLTMTGLESQMLIVDSVEALVEA